MRAACSSTPTGRGSARRSARHGVDGRGRGARPPPSRTPSGGSTPATRSRRPTTSSAAGPTSTSCSTEAGVALSDATAAALAELHVYHQTVQPVGVGPGRGAAVARGAPRARAAAGGRVERQRRAASRLRSPRADRRRSTSSSTRTSKASKSPIRASFRSRSTAPARDAETTMHVGDLYHVDVAGARAAGITPALLDVGEPVSRVRLPARAVADRARRSARSANA